MLGGIIVSLIISSWPSFRNLVWLSCGPKSGMRRTISRGAGADLRYVGDFVYRAADPVPVSFGIALFLTELAPGWLNARWVSPLSCWQPFQVSFTAVGPVYLCAAVRRLLPGAGRHIMSNIPIVGALFSGPAFGIVSSRQA